MKIKVDSYSIDYYMSIGKTLEEATNKVNDNKLKGSIGVRLASAKKRIKKYHHLVGFAPNQLLEFERVSANSRIFGANPSDSNKLHKTLIMVMGARCVDVYEALDLINEALLKFPAVVNPNASTAFTKFLYGEDSDKFKQKLIFNRNTISCTFELFSKNYEDKELARILFNEKYGSNNALGMMKKLNISEEAAKEIINERSARGVATFKSRPEAEQLISNRKKAFSLANFIARFGEILGKLQYDVALAKKKGQSSRSWYVEKYGETEGNRLYDTRKGRHNIYYCVEYWTHRGMNQEDAEAHIKSLFLVRPNFSLQFCIEKYGIVAGTKIHIARTELWQSTLKAKPQSAIDDMNRRKGITIDGMISKYGEVEGIVRYNDWISNIGKSGGMSSRSANRFFVKLYKKLRRLGVLDKTDECYFGISGSKEFNINMDGKVRFYDFTIPKLNVIVEYNGCTYHAREWDYNWVSPYGRTYLESVENDRLKLDMATTRGFDLLYVWDDEDEDFELNKALMFIMDKI